MQKVVIQLENEEYGLDIMKVESIERYQEITKVPLSDSMVKGMTNLRDEVLPVVDLKKKLNHQDIEITNQTRIVVVHVDERKIGFLVDGVKEIITVDEEQMSPVPMQVLGSTSRYIEAVVNMEDSMIIILNSDKLMQEDSTVILSAS